MTTKATKKKQQTAPTKRGAAKAGPAGIKLRTILVPTDFSDESLKALKYASSFARQFGAKIALAHVLVPVAAPDLIYGPLVWDEPKAQKSAKKRLTEVLEKTGVGKNVKTQTIVRVGHPYHEIDQIAKKIRADLIIISNHGYTGLKHLLLGSVAERVIRHAPCPVLVVRDKEHEFVDV